MLMDSRLETDTDWEGMYFTRDALPPGDYFAATRNYSGYIDELYDDVQCMVCDPTSATPISVGVGELVTGVDFALDAGATISGTIIDSETSDPLAEIQAWLFDENGDYVSEGQTDEAGNYTIGRGLLPGVYYAVTYNWSNYINHMYGGSPCPQGCDPTEGVAIQVGESEAVTGIDFALSKASLIVGEVTDAADGTPLEGISVRIYDEYGNYVTYCSTDSEGRYETTSSIPVGVYYVKTGNAQGYVDELFDDIPCLGYCYAPSGTAIEVLEGLSPTVNFALDRGGTIAGTVTDQQTGSGLHRIYIVVFDSDGKRISEVGTDTNGMYYYSSALPPGNYYVRTYNKSGYINEVFDNFVCLGACDVTAGTPISIGLGEDVTGIDFALAKGATISGTITDGATSAPLPGVSARIYDENCNYRTRGRTDEEGNYTSEDGLVAGQHYVVTDSSSHYVNEMYDNVPCPYGCQPKDGLTISVGDAEAVTGIDFSLEIGGWISGSVVNETTGEGLQSLPVDVYDASGQLVGRAYPGSDGSYETDGLPTGNYFVVTDADYNYVGFVEEVYDDIECAGCDVTMGTPVVVTVGEGTPGIDFALRQGPQIAGRIADAVTGLGIDDSSVMIFNDTGGLATSGESDSNGDFTAVGGLPDGTYYAATSNWAGYANQLYDGLPYFDEMDVTRGTPITISDGVAPPPIEFLLNAGCTVAGSVTHQSTGAGLSDIDVILHNASGAEVATWTTDAGGDFSSGPSLAAGTYYVRTSSAAGFRDLLYDGITWEEGFDATWGTAIVLADDEERLDINFVLVEVGFIEGTVTDEVSGEGLEGVLVMVFDSGGSQVAMAGTDQDGSYVVDEGLDPGTYFLLTENYEGYFDEVFDDQICPGVCDPTTGTPVVVGPGEAVSAIDFALAKGGSIAGTVTDVATGLGIKNVVVEFYDSNGAFVAEGFTDADGNYLTQTAVLPGTYYSKTDSVWAQPEYDSQLYDGLDCSDGCNVTSGTPIIVMSDEAVTGINYLLRKTPLFEDGFESGDCEQWSLAAGLI